VRGSLGPKGEAVRPAAFLDRDGVISVDHGFTYLTKDLVFTPTAIEGIKAFNDAACRLFVVTNQSGVARGYYSPVDVERFHAAMQERLLERGAHIDCFYYCPFHPEGCVTEYAIDHEDRKPSPGMLLRAIRKWPTDVAASVMIGDRRSAVQAGARAGLTGFRSSRMSVIRAFEPAFAKAASDLRPKKPPD
jgi:D-glycero-D-manno-heptose 1,7-bisphosphate phosphatase